MTDTERIRQLRADGRAMVIYGVRIPAELRIRMRDHAVAHGMSLNAAITLAIEEYLDRYSTDKGAQS